MNNAMKLKIIMGLLVLSRFATAATIVQWGARGGEEIISTSYLMVYSGISTLQTNTPANPALGVNGYYTGHAADRSWRFYQAMTGAEESGIYDPNFIGASDALFFQDMANSATPLTTVVFWKKEDFLNGMSAAETIAPTSFHMEAATDDAQAIARWMVQDSGGLFYVSSAISIANNGGGNYGVYELTDVGSASWYVFDPTTDITVIGSEATGLSVSDISGVGFYAYTDAEGSHDYIQIRNFEVDAVPEPASIVLIGMVSALGFFIRRRFSD